MCVKNADLVDISRSNVKLTQTVNRHKIMDMDEVEAVVKATEEVGVAAVRAEVCDLRKMRMTETTLARIKYFLCKKLITC